MVKIPPDERLVYLACQHIFRGPNAQLRKQTKIKNLIQQNQLTIGGIIQEHDIDSVCQVAKGLLEEQIFESTLKAKMRFPELFDVSPTQSADREASEAEAARDEASAVREITANTDSKPELLEYDSDHPTKNNQDYQVRGIVVEDHASLPKELY
jgi:hypothetical protein